jgi:hypothetical protein
MEFLKIFLFALFLYASGLADTNVGWYNGVVWNSGRIILQGSKSIWSDGGAWKLSRNWNTGNAWNINNIWNSNSSGITYSFLSNMSNWNSLPNNFNVAYSNISSCYTWNSWKSLFKKQYNSNQTQELIRYVLGTKVFFMHFLIQHNIGVFLGIQYSFKI